eukprot:CAMPEP_0194492244 /NCGR_PEP_ID=MMETSP0253-20130528/10869_1 /TAXON_ID=2966 /ORGANISM="Noctiluca scintillans" /LENGTH=530 /DNA_ID=CAMNT_0039333087 /DNA_START=1 /DNA_END=1590 /DNA_ORIENTATION=+
MLDEAEIGPRSSEVTTTALSLEDVGLATSPEPRANMSPKVAFNVAPLDAVVQEKSMDLSLVSHSDPSEETSSTFKAFDSMLSVGSVPKFLMHRMSDAFSAKVPRGPTTRFRDARCIVGVRVLSVRDLPSDDDPVSFKVAYGAQRKRSSVQKVKEGAARWDGDQGRVELKMCGADVLRVVVYQHARKQGCRSSSVCGATQRQFYGESLFNVDSLHETHMCRRKTYAAGVRLYFGIDALPASIDIEFFRRRSYKFEQDDSDSEDGQVSRVLVQPVLAHFIHHQALGIVQNMASPTDSRGNVMQPFATFAVILQGVPAIFGEHRCHGTDGAHHGIFAESTAGTVARRWFKARHQALHRKPRRTTKPSLFQGTRQNHGTCALRSGHDLLCLMKFGMDRGKACVFTYSLIDEGLFFSETSCAALKDTNSKHIVHANGNLSVFCAGTLRICRSPDGEYVLVFDNDSGTYMPGEESLELMERTLKHNFASLLTRRLDVRHKELPPEMSDWEGPDEVKGTRTAVYAGQWKWQPVTTNW